MDTKKVEKLIQLLKKNNLYEIEVEDEGERLRLVNMPSHGIPGVMPTAMIREAPPSFEVSASAGGGAKVHDDSSVPESKKIRSPFVGTYYASASPGAEAFVRIGQKVRKGDTLCIIEAMKIMNEIEAERDCEIKEILIHNESPVEFNQALFIVD